MVLKVIDLFAADTPNGKKISIMLEEINLPYNVIPVDLNKGEQFEKKFIEISPFSKIPVIKDNEKNVFGSGAILIYLAEKSTKFYDLNNKVNIDQWLMAQMGLIGPMIGQYHSFYRFNKGKSKYGEERYFKITKDLYERLNKRLSLSNYLAGDQYTIADIVYLFSKVYDEEGNWAKHNFISPNEATLYLTISGRSFSKYISI